jgi:hypothetical protein
VPERVVNKDLTIIMVLLLICIVVVTNNNNNSIIIITVIVVNRDLDGSSYLVLIITMLNKH